ncbi:MAG: bacillithiol biosynthesis deacetylase BshB1 [Firmicutes bacterium]|nr:bacillithiol biosynthesis deacetylase BshB1 [Bacillota bacterium]
MQLDILAFGPHPDDVEIGIGGTLIKHARLGYKIGIVDLTAGEAGTNGTPETRRRESLAAAEIMGAAVRDCLGLPDARLEVTETMLVPVIEIIRRYRPLIVLGPLSRDGHPDHQRAEQLVLAAAHKAGLRKYPASGESFRPPVVLQYLLGSYRKPDLVVDISPYYEEKMRAIAAHKSQFEARGNVETYVNDPAFLYAVRARDMFCGSLIQVAYGEAIFTDRQLAIDDLLSLQGPKRMSEERRRV